MIIKSWLVFMVLVSTQSRLCLDSTAFEKQQSHHSVALSFFVFITKVHWTPLTSEPVVYDIFYLYVTFFMVKWSTVPKSSATILWWHILTVARPVAINQSIAKQGWNWSQSRTQQLQCGNTLDSNWMTVVNHFIWVRLYVIFVVQCYICCTTKCGNRT